MFRLTLLPAREGDCLLATYGKDERTPTHMLIDGGRAGTWNDIKEASLLEMGAGARFEAIVVTHIDRDHIEGILKLSADRDFGAEVGDVWFNGYKHLSQELEEFGVAQAEKLSIAIATRKWPWNMRFDNKAVKISDGEGAPGTIELESGLRVTLLSPTSDGLKALEKDWDKWLAKAGIKKDQEEPAEELPPDDIESYGAPPVPDLDALCAEEEDPDDGIPNGSSIAFLLEYEGKKVLCGADAHPDILEAALRRMGFSETNRLKIDLLKVPHHGSGRNVSAALLAMIDCGHFAISTDGSHHEHPDDVALARIVRSSGEFKTIYFNYDQPRMSAWNDPTFMQANNFQCVFPDPAHEGRIDIDVLRLSAAAGPRSA
jgi:beta-lactamase superfamily II metal-dependent hydrolase